MYPRRPAATDFPTVAMNDRSTLLVLLVGAIGGVALTLIVGAVARPEYEPAAQRDAREASATDTTGESLADWHSLQAAPREETPPAPPTTEPRQEAEAWIPSRPDLVLAGRTSEEVLADWWGDQWPALRPLLTDQLWDGIWPEGDELGDPDACLEILPERFAKWFDRGAHDRLAKGMPGVQPLRVLFSPDDLIDAVTRSLTYNPTGRDFDRESAEWSWARDWLTDEHAALREVGDDVLALMRSTILADLERTDRFRPPELGLLFFGPIRTVPHPDFQDDGVLSLWRLTLLAGDSMSACKTFSGCYSIDFHDVPVVASSIESLELYRQDLEQRTRDVVAGLP